MFLCTHTSDWWKNQKPCFACGETYSDEKAQKLCQLMYIRYGEFTPEQQAIITQLEQEQEEIDAS